MTTSFSQAPLPSCLLQAVELLTHATGPDPKLDIHWFSQWRVWLEGMRAEQYTPGAMRLRHALALFAVQAIEDQDRPYNQEAVVCMALYLASLCEVDARELRAPMWQTNDDIEAAYAEVPHPSRHEDVPWTTGPDKPVSAFLVMDVVCGVMKTINFKVQQGTPYRHCAPLLMRLLASKDWDPCAVIAHFRALRSEQFELLNAGAQDLPGESQTVHGMLAMHLFSYMHSSSWKPAPSPHLGVLDEVVWDALCLTGLGNQAGDWLDTLKSCLPNAGLGVLQIPNDSGQTSSKEGLAPLTTICTPAFSSLRAYAAVASQDMGRGIGRAHWFERRYHRLAHAMGTLLLVLPTGARQAGDWDALNAWWRLEVQGLAADAETQAVELPADFE